MMKSKLGIVSTILILVMWCTSANAHFIDSVSIAGGKGRPDNLRGVRIALQKDWNYRLFHLGSWFMTGYWDANLAYFRTNGNINGAHKAITIIGFNPVFRFQSGQRIWGLTPYLEASVGIAGLSKRHLGHRNLGANWAFEDLLGFGTRFGHHQQYDLSLHFLHYSNADIDPPNEGIDVKWLLMLRYYFT